MAFDVVDGEFDPSNGTVPETFTDRIDPAWLALSATQATATRRLRFGRKNGLWVVNDQTWSAVARSGFQRTVHDVPSGATEIWDLENEGGGWYHPVHLHLVDVKILDRDGRPPRPYETGPKDVVFLGENQRVRVVTKYPAATTGRTGRYMIHCHITTHEDHDMMLQYRVGAAPPANDPIAAAPARAIPAEWGL